MRLVRRSLLLAAIAVASLPLSATVAGGQEVPDPSFDDLTITIRKVVVGTGSPSAVTADCVGNSEAGALAGFVFNFDGQGNPTTSNGPFEIVDGAWVISESNGGGGTCTFTETTTGGAASTSWTCAYSSTPWPSVVPEAQAESAGCAATAGTGVGPVQVIYPGDEFVSSQQSTVVFTNTFAASPPPAPIPAAQIVAKPAFTG